MSTTVVLGAAGGAGSAITTELVERGHRVIGVTRSGQGPDSRVEYRAADLLDISSLRRAVTDADVVVDAAQPSYAGWAEHLETMVNHALAATTDVGARFVWVDNLYMYAPAAGVLTESSPEHASDKKGALRRRIGEIVLAAHDRGKVRATMGRYSDYYGPGATNSSLFVTGIGPGIKGRKMRGLFDIDQPRTFAYLPDTAKAFATLVENPKADGRPWILPAAEPVTQRQIMELVNDHLPKRVGIGTVSSGVMAMASIFSKDLREARSVEVQFTRPWITNAQQFEAAFGAIELTPHDEAVRTTVRSFLTGQAMVSGRSR